jgi:hypothetical protein
MTKMSAARPLHVYFLNNSEAIAVVVVKIFSIFDCTTNSVAGLKDV